MTLKFIMRRREGSSWGGIERRKRMHQGHLFIENRRQWPVLALFPPNTGIDGDVLWPYFTSGFMLMTRLPVILAKFDSRPGVWARSWIDGNGMDGGGIYGPIEPPRRHVEGPPHSVGRPRDECGEFWPDATYWIPASKQRGSFVTRHLVEEESETCGGWCWAQRRGHFTQDLAQCENGTRVLIDGLQLDKYKILEGADTSRGADVYMRMLVCGQCARDGMRGWRDVRGWREWTGMSRR
ncbi:hypothetical protein EV421DRAFT_1736947 [Armillaria borealis]|uniref:Uncharacterized protein n=1 Tax=Armillaria borealis TaxID=47425 RepID=A0AA39JGR5_9AGAR|nr:hypothetical protein EV421DRAFT_1736947 [Armillaria borealis]